MEESNYLGNLIGQDDSPLIPTPHSGEWLAWLGGIKDESARLFQDVTLPSDGPAFLRYYYQIDSEKNSCNQDWMRLLVGATVLDTWGLCSAANTQDWVADSVDLSAYTGQSITIMFEVVTDSAQDTSSFFIDDVSLVRNP